MDKYTERAVTCPLEGAAHSNKVLPLLSIDEVKILPLAPKHIWKVIVCEEIPMVLRVVDMTNQVYGRAKTPRDMIVGRMNMSEGPSQTVNLILNGMKNPPGPGSDNPEFYRPRRPRFLLVDPKLESIFPGIKETIELLCIPVRLNSERSYNEAALIAEQSTDQHHTHRCTYSEGLTSATASIVRQLPQNADETWKVFVYSHEVSPTGIILVVENHTKKKKTLVGNGPTDIMTIGQGILAVMLSPVVGPAGGKGEVHVDTPRRPGKIVLNSTLESSFSEITEVMLGSGVEVLKDSVFSKKFGRCFYPECGATNRFGEKDRYMMCSCLAVAYCSKSCQKSHWKEHKKTCECRKNKNRET